MAENPGAIREMIFNYLNTINNRKKKTAKLIISRNWKNKDQQINTKTIKRLWKDRKEKTIWILDIWKDPQSNLLIMREIRVNLQWDTIYHLSGHLHLKDL